MTGTARDRLVVHVPGKLFIAGEYAVVNPGEPAILAAVDLGITVTLDPTSATREVHSPGYPSLRWMPGPTGIEVAPPHHGSDYVVAALTVVDALRRSRGVPVSAFDIDIDSGLDHGSGRKYGLGSSAAVTVGVVRAVGRHLGLGLSPLEEYRLAMLATTSVAPTASGGDVAASAFGGWILYRSPDRHALAAAAASGHTIDELLTAPAWDRGGILHLTPPAGMGLVVGWTGAPASTTSLVAAVRTAIAGGEIDHDRFLSDSRDAVLALRDAFDAGDLEAAQHALRDARGVLRRLGDQSAVAIETAALGRMCDIIEERGAAAKPSGAGGGDCGIALVGPDFDRPALEADWRANGIDPLPLAVAEREGGRRVG
ncbi:phosphomevalonate kinase [Microbacterium aquimaris]|uniref:phosphomevalonate kinase n=1 Tax=Microbacterium aquimaris TaxID=459816 RepID=UPI002AD4DC42|nr:phosphomevalonate kinase [Microbacterium aquimaris]MDZ8276041.1 phosphomevalonate kinase [Microbacterium aquimaris]